MLCMDTDMLRMDTDTEDMLRMADTEDMEDIRGQGISREVGEEGLRLFLILEGMGEGEVLFGGMVMVTEMEEEEEAMVMQVEMVTETVMAEEEEEEEEGTETE